MITLTKLNGNRFVLNAELIRTIEENPDTIVTLVSGDKIVVKEKIDEVVERAIEYARRAGAEAIVLETASRLVEARGLYERYGFATSEDQPPAERCDLTMRLRL